MHPNPSSPELREVLVIGSNVFFPSRTSSDVTWLTSPFFRVTNSANFRTSMPVVHTTANFEVNEEGLIVSTGMEDSREGNSFAAKLFSFLCQKLRLLGQRVGFAN